MSQDDLPDFGVENALIRMPGDCQVQNSIWLQFFQHIQVKPVLSKSFFEVTCNGATQKTFYLNGYFQSLFFRCNRILFSA